MKDVYKEITDHIIGSVDEAGQWKPCWRGGMNRPVNAVTKAAYRGVNVLMCWLTAQHAGYPTQEWASYRQWASIGAQVKKGEKGTPIVFYKITESTDPAADDDHHRIFVRSSYVFNAAQVEGYVPAAAEPKLTTIERIERCDAWLAERMPHFTLHHTDEGRAYYRPSTDSVTMPRFASFDHAEGYYSVLLHELTHWTGAKHRLDREFRRERESYAKEELVAELGSAFLGAELGIETATRSDHVAYIASWLKALKDDKRLIVRAASLANAAADYLTQLPVHAEQREAA